MLYRVKSLNGSPGYKRVYKQNYTYHSRWEEEGNRNSKVWTIVVLRDILPQGTLGLFLGNTTLCSIPKSAFAAPSPPSTLPCCELLIGEEKILVPSWHLELLSEEYLREVVEEIEEAEKEEKEKNNAHLHQKS